MSGPEHRTGFFCGDWQNKKTFTKVHFTTKINFNDQIIFIKIRPETGRGTNRSRWDV
ncbi:hypothetical protein SAMN05421790_11191 [Kroppenstedtia eburnea]|uniref:Uncharacterized protein n=1 Tax=Kroppenstedtia eburnea TaxID=714067 RepID=A0A1N7P5V5_9BACL|nr:hypothetical protein SAMN05421790_11191 [Kroppenstedtia eburnea]